MEKIKQAAMDEGYEIAYAGESYGNDFLGVAILVKMSNRKLCDMDKFYQAADLIQANLNRVSAETDPTAPAQRARYRAEIEEIYGNAGVRAIYVQQIQNGYCNNPCCLNKPWFEVTSIIGRVVIGWRKHVISIDWKNSTIKVHGEVLSSDKVTRWETGIHALDVVKATEYIRLLHQRVADGDT